MSMLTKRISALLSAVLIIAVLGAPSDALAAASNTTSRPGSRITALSDALASRGLVAPAETDRLACAVDISDTKNPYDVVYDYGARYDAIAKKCDWNKIFDADYYIETFPGLAKQYHNDKDLLLKHFQTVGIREGRQGSEDFNVKKYMESVPKSVSSALGDDYEGYYIYYMLGGYAPDKSFPGGDGYPVQLTVRPTAIQKEEIGLINKSRAANKRPESYIYSELCAFANYRAYVDAVNKLRGHDYIHDMDGIRDVSEVLIKMGVETFSENTIKTGPYRMLKWFETYKTSRKHYETAIKGENVYVGVSNAYVNEDFKMVQFDIFINGDNAEKISGDPKYVPEAA